MSPTPTRTSTNQTTEPANVLVTVPGFEEGRYDMLEFQVPPGIARALKRVDDEIPLDLLVEWWSLSAELLYHLPPFVVEGICRHGLELLRDRLTAPSLPALPEPADDA